MKKATIMSNAEFENPTVGRLESKVSPIATFNGQVVLNLPKDLYIPPDAMTVLLETFEGPLDLLLYLIKKQNLDILDIPIAKVTQQYLEYIDLMKNLSLELAAEYLLMAAILAEIKSRMLLPRPPLEDVDEADPRAELVKRLQEYERFKQAAEDINKLSLQERDIFIVKTEIFPLTTEVQPQPVDLADLLNAFNEVLKRLKLRASHHIELETLSVREKMSHILANLKNTDYAPLATLFNLEEGRPGIVVTFLAMLELLKQSLIEFVQAAPFAPIYLRAKA